MGYGYAMAQDRLFQMDYLRRRALGRLAEVLGPEAFDYDLLVRTVGLHRIAAEETARLPAETAGRYEAFAAGVNAFIEECRDRAADRVRPAGLSARAVAAARLDRAAGRVSLVSHGAVSGDCDSRVARRALGDGPLYRAFMTAEAIDETILHPGEYATAGSGTDPLEPQLGGVDDCTGSNNWVVGPSRSVSGGGMVVSDPHIAFGSPGCWYQVHLVGGRFNVAGSGYAGAPGIIFGRNLRVAWGITNNISSQRDLYQERTDPAHPGAFLYDGQWEPARERVEAISVRGEGVREEVVRSSRNGPIVDQILPGFAQGTGPVSLRWAGALPCAWPTALLEWNLAGSCDELEDALRGWVSPTLSMVLADVDGGFGFRATGQVPLRSRVERGYRRGWDPGRRLAGHDSVRGHAERARPRARLGGNGEQSAGAIGLSVSAVQHVAERLPRAAYPADDRGARGPQPRGHGGHALRPAVVAGGEFAVRGADAASSTAATRGCRRPRRRCAPGTAAWTARAPLRRYSRPSTSNGTKWSPRNAFRRTRRPWPWAIQPPSWRGALALFRCACWATTTLGWFASAEARDTKVRSTMARTLDPAHRAIGRRHVRLELGRAAYGCCCPTCCRTAATWGACSTAAANPPAGTASSCATRGPHRNSNRPVAPTID